MKRLSIIDMGTEAQGVELKGDRRNPEPTYFRVRLPFGDVDVARCDAGEYWVHVRVNRPGDDDVKIANAPVGEIKDARLDAKDKHAGTIDATVLADPTLYHVAIRVGAPGVKETP